MCGRYRNTQSRNELHGAMERFLGPTSQTPLNMMSMEQVRPTNQAPVIRLVDGAPTVGNARWWLTPRFHKKPLKEWKATTFNARAETVKTAANFRQCFAQRRCLVVADGWYEWTGPRGASSPGCSRQRLTSRRWH